VEVFDLPGSGEDPTPGSRVTLDAYAARLCEVLASNAEPAVVALEQASAEIREQKPSIAVLPFANFSRDANDEYFSDGLVEELINALAQVEGVKVIARTSAFAFKGQNQDIRRIAHSLGASNVVEGSVRRSGNCLRVTAQLIRAAAGTQIWSQRYDRKIRDEFAVQDEICAAVVNRLKASLVAPRLLTRNQAHTFSALP
jgi:TolB-like protein